MPNRKYIVEVTVKMKSPDGQDLGTVTKPMEMNVDMDEFSNNTDADTHMMEEVSSMADAAVFHIGNCFN